MTARAHSRGWPTEWDGERWVYSDTKQLDDGIRSCFRCGCVPTSEGFDACLGLIKGAVSACCGHGVEKPYVVQSSGDKKNEV